MQIPSSAFMEKFTLPSSDAWHMASDSRGDVYTAQWDEDSTLIESNVVTEVVDFNCGNDAHPLEGSHVVCLSANHRTENDDGTFEEGKSAVYLDAEEAKDLGFALLAMSGELRNRKI